jgi:hypothetical protein
MDNQTAATLEPRLSQHPISATFPAMTEADFTALMKDIKAHGQRMPITVYEDQVLDGWHRYRACQQLSITPRLEEFTGIDPVAFVISLNLKRRHLTESQRAMLGAELANLPTGVHACTPASKPRSAAAVAKRLKVSRRSVFSAKSILKHGTPRLVAAVKAGQVSVRKAAQQVRAKPSPPPLNDGHELAVALGLTPPLSVATRRRLEARRRTQRTQALRMAIAAVRAKSYSFTDRAEFRQTLRQIADDWDKHPTLSDWGNPKRT